MGIKLSASLRDNKNASVLRREGFIPAILYGHKIENVELVISQKDFNKIYQEVGENTMIELDFDSGKKKEKRPVLVTEVQYDNLANEPIHIDFYQVRLDEKISAEVPVHFIGEAPAVKALGGILVKSIHEIKVEALPQDLPHGFEVDLSKLENFESSIYIRDLLIPQGVKVLLPLETVVVSVTPPRSEEEIAATKEEVAEKVEEVKVETEEKKAEREQEKAEGKEDAA